MKKYLVPLALIAIVSAFCSCTETGPFAPVANGSITGYVYKQTCCSDSNYYAYEGALIELFRNSTTYDQDTNTDNTGYYEFMTVTPGTYDVVVTTYEWIYTPESRTGTASYEAIDCDNVNGSESRVTKTAVNVVSNEEVTVDFRFTGY